MDACLPRVRQSPATRYAGRTVRTLVFMRMASAHPQSAAVR